MHTLPYGVRIPNLAALDDAIADGNHDYAVVLRGLLSRKTITKKGSRYVIENDIDGSTQRLTTKQLMDRNYTNVGVAIQHGAFIVCP